MHVVMLPSIFFLSWGFSSFKIIYSVCPFLGRVKSCQMVQEIVHWNFLWATMDGLPIMKMASVIRLMQQNACFLLVIVRRSFAWDRLTV